MSPTCVKSPSSAIFGKMTVGTTNDETIERARFLGWVPLLLVGQLMLAGFALTSAFPAHAADATLVPIDSTAEFETIPGRPAESAEILPDDMIRIDPEQFAAAAASPQPAATVGETATGDPLSETIPPLPKATTRFVIGLGQSTTYRVSALSNPNRVIVDLDSTTLELPPAVGDTPTGLVKAFRSGVSAPGQTRVVIDVIAPVMVTHDAVEDTAENGGARLVLDLAQVAGKTADADGAKETASPRANYNPPIPRRTTLQETLAARIYKPTIVLDPGHGGMDTGAQKYGTVEKEVVLAFGHILKAKLEETGRYKVLMTRETDVSVELDERRLFAERNKASLFIAIHADSSSNNARGATIYSLNHALAADLKQVAKGAARREVLSREEVGSISSSNADIEAVRGFLSDLAERELEANRDRTTLFTRSIVEYMGKSTNLKDEPDRTAQFRVLRTVKMPAVLIELGYVSNEDDAIKLRSQTWRDKVTQSLVNAIENYFAQNIASLPL